MICIVSRSVKTGIWLYMNAYIVRSCHISVLCVFDHLLSKYHWKGTTAQIHGRGYIPVMSVILICHSVGSIIWRIANQFIMTSFHILLVYVISCSFKRVIWWNIKAHAVGCPYTCGVCDESFRRRGDMKVHQQKHSGERRYSCDVYKKAFSRWTNLHKHELTHGERKYSCDVCSKSFVFKNALKVRVHESIHSGECPYICNVCNGSFRLKAQLTRHQRAHTGPLQVLGQRDILVYDNRFSEFRSFTSFTV
jgi:hypothetical protein